MPGERPWLGRAIRRLVVFTFLFSISAFPRQRKRKTRPAFGTSCGTTCRNSSRLPPSPATKINYSEKIRAKLAAFHPVVDNLGDVIVTIGSGAPHRLIVTPIDEPGFVVSAITPDGYLRLERLPQAGNLPPIFNALYSAQAVKVRTASGKWLDGIVAGISVHLHRSAETLPPASDIGNMYVDIGATSAAEVRAAGVDLLSPVAINRELAELARKRMAGASVGDKFGSVALVSSPEPFGDPAKFKGTLTVAFVTQQRVGGRGFDRILRDDTSRTK